MSDQMHVAQSDRPDEVRDVLDDGGHRVVLDPSRVVRIALAETVEREHASELRNPFEIPAPVGGTIGAQVGAEIAAVQKHDRLALAFLEIASADAIYVDVSLIAQWHARALRRSNERRNVREKRGIVNRRPAHVSRRPSTCVLRRCRVMHPMLSLSANSSWARADDATQDTRFMRSIGRS